MRERTVSFWDYAELDDGSWLISSALFDGLCKLDPKSGSVSYIGPFEDNNILKRNIHSRVFKCHMKYYFFPSTGLDDIIYCWDESDKVVRGIDLPKNDIFRSERKYEYARIDNQVWIISREISIPIMCFDLDTEQFIVKGNWNHKLQSYIKRADLPFSISIAVVKDRLFIPIWDTFSIAEINTRTEEIKIHSLKPDQGIRLELMVPGERDIYYLTSRGTNDIFCWNYNTGMIKRITHWQIQEERCIRSYEVMCYHQKKVFLVPSFGNRCCYIDQGSNEVKPFGQNLDEIIASWEDRINYPRLFGVCKQIGDRIIICPGNMEKTLVIDTNEMSVFSFVYKLAVSELKQAEIDIPISQAVLKGSKILIENPGIVNQKTLLQIIKNTLELQSDISLSKEVCGRKIHEFVKSELLSLK